MVLKNHIFSLSQVSSSKHKIFSLLGQKTGTIQKLELVNIIIIKTAAD